MQIYTNNYLLNVKLLGGSKLKKTPKNVKKENLNIINFETFESPNLLSMDQPEFLSDEEFLETQHSTNANTRYQEVYSTLETRPFITEANHNCVDSVILRQSLNNKQKKIYSETQPYESRIDQFIKTGNMTIPDKFFKTNPGPNHEYMVRCSTPGHLMNEKFEHDAFRVNVSRHHWEQKAVEINIIKKKEELKEKDNQDRMSKLMQPSFVNKKANININQFITNKIYGNAEKSKKEYKSYYDNQNKKNELERLHNSYFRYDEKYSITKHKKFKRDIIKNHKFLNDLLTTEPDKQYNPSNIPDFNYVTSCVNQNMFVYNYINKLKKRFEFYKVFVNPQDSNRLDALVDYMNTIDSNKTAQERSYAKYMVFKGNRFDFFPKAPDLVSVNLKYLTINQCKIGLKSLQRIIDRVKVSTNLSLKYINFAENDLNGHDVSMLLYMMLAIPTLHTLDLSFNHVTELNVDYVEKYFNNRSTCNLRRFVLRSCELNIFSFSELMLSICNNLRLRELDVSNNELIMKSTTRIQEKVRVKDNISTFMLSNKTLTHLMLSGSNIDRSTAELLVSIFMLRPNMMLIHTERNPQVFDAVSLISLDWYMKVWTQFDHRLTGCSYCDRTVLREAKITTANFARFTEVKNTLVYLYCEYYEFNPILMAKNDISFYCKLHLPKYEVRFFVRNDLGEVFNLDQYFRSDTVSENDNPMFKKYGVTKLYYFDSIIKKPNKLESVGVDIKENTHNSFMGSIDKAIDWKQETLGRLPNYNKKKAAPNHSFNKDFLSPGPKNHPYGMKLPYDRKTFTLDKNNKDTPSGPTANLAEEPAEEEKAPKFDVNIKTQMKFKRPPIELTFLHQEETIKFDDNEYLKLYNYRKVFKECCAFDINNSNIFKWLSEGMKVDNHSIEKVLNGLVQLNYEKFVDIYVWLLALNNPRANDLSFQIREKTFYQLVGGMQLYDENLTQEVLDLAFYAVNNDISMPNARMVGSNINEGNADNMLVRKELYEIFLRMALSKFWFSRDSGTIVKCFERLVDQVWASIPVHMLTFKKKHVDCNDVNRAYNCNRALFRLTFGLYSERKFVSVENFFKVVKLLNVDVSTQEMIYHWLCSVAMSPDDYVNNRYGRCDYNEFVEVWLRIFDIHWNELLGGIDYELFESLYKIEKKYVVFKLNRITYFDLDMKVIIFSSLFSKVLNLESREVKAELQDNFNRTKTLIYYSNMFYEEDLSDAEEERLDLHITPKAQIDPETNQEIIEPIKMKSIANLKSSNNRRNFNQENKIGYGTILELKEIKKEVF